MIRSIQLIQFGECQRAAIAEHASGNVSGPERHLRRYTLDDVFDEAAQQLRDGSGRAAVILISDGAATLPDRASAAARPYNIGVRIVFARQVRSGGVGTRLGMSTTR